MTTSPESDSAVRERALDPRRSIVLEAPAGSGKTTVLAQRLLRLLATVDEPEQVLAITFTRKAAAEMRERVWYALQGDVESASAHGRRLLELAEAVRERSRNLGWALELSPARLRIQTFDSLNRSLASEGPLAAHGAGEQPIADSPADLYALAARRTVLDAESDPRFTAHLEDLLERLDNDFERCERLLARMLEQRSQWLPALMEGARAERTPEHAGRETTLTARVTASLVAIAGERVRVAEELFPGSLITEGVSLARAAAQRRRESGDRAKEKPGAWRIWASEPETSGSLRLEHWKALGELALTQSGRWRASFTVREGFPAAEKERKRRARDWIAHLQRIAGAQEALVQIVRLPNPHLSGAEARSLESLAHLLRLAASELEVLFEELGRVDYPGIAAAALQVLREEGAPTEFGLKLATRLRHILVDEFQDTSIEQMDLLETLTAGWEPGDGRTLFIVGDPMQSIYQFRQAEVGLFLRVAARGIGDLPLEPLRLTRNFRSAPRLAAWFNEVFATCFEPIDDPRTSAVRYRPCCASRLEPAGVVEFHPTESADPLAEAHAVAALVGRLRRGAPGASIAILLASRSHASPIVAALGAAHIPVSGVDIVPLGELPVVRDLEALTRALDHLADRTAWLAVLRAPWCGLTLSELSALVGDATYGTVWEAIQDAQRVGRLELDSRARLARTRAALAVALGQKDRLRPAEYVEATWLRLGGPAACTEDGDLEHASAFFTGLERWSSQPEWRGPLELHRRLGQLYARHSGSAADAVQIMTIHRAKGLEFDRVILPGLGRRMRASPEPLLRWLELPAERRGADLLMTPIGSAAEGSSRLGEYVRQLETQRAAHERIRVMYVAATRARDELHLFAAPPRPSREGTEPTPAAGSLLASVWPALRGAFVRSASATGKVDVRGERVEDTRTSNALPATAAAMGRLTRLSSQWRCPEIAPAELKQYVTDAQYDEAGTGPAALDSELVSAQAVADQLRHSARVGHLPGTADSWRPLRERLSRFGLSGGQLDARTIEAQRLLEACLADPRLRWIFSPAHEQCESPLSLTGVHDGRLVSVVIDRSFIDKGVRWLIDFRAELGPHDEPEVARPVALASGLGAEPVQRGIYLPLTRQFVSSAALSPLQ